MARSELFFPITLLMIIASCKTSNLPIGKPDESQGTLDYSSLALWASHPEKIDAGDETPDKLKNEAPSEVDIFFIHPTMYYGDKGENKWNADVTDKKFNTKVDQSSIKFQASAWNQAGSLYAPRYRQAHINAYFTKDRKSSKQAFDLAYIDVREAFQYYLQHWNRGKPIIIASHSQGTQHAVTLMKEFFDNKLLKNKLVVAYLIGMPVTKTAFTDIPICEDEDQTGCFVSWRTYRRNYDPLYQDQGQIAIVNPLSWTTDTSYISKTKNEGSVLRKFNKTLKQSVDAQIHGGILWATKPKFPGSIFYTSKNFHIGDINFYYMNIRKNAQHRVGMFWKR